jgi:uncharacterized protein YqfA (UPF0365 family)
LDSAENGQKNTLQNVKYLKVRVLDLHLQIETGELGHMSRGVGVLSTENRARAEDTLTTSSNLELLVELGGLGEESLLSEVGESEDVTTTLGGGTDKAGRLEFLEMTGLEVVAEESLDFDTDVLCCCVSK